jgi:hypothetical protein
MKTGKEEQVRLLRRILVSYNDFKQAAHISSHILAAKLHRDYPEKDRHNPPGIELRDDCCLRQTILW